MKWTQSSNRSYAGERRRRRKALKLAKRAWTETVASLFATILLHRRPCIYQLCPKGVVPAQSHFFSCWWAVSGEGSSDSSYSSHEYDEEELEKLDPETLARHKRYLAHKESKANRRDRERASRQGVPFRVSLGAIQFFCSVPVVPIALIDAVVVCCWTSLDLKQSLWFLVGGNVDEESGSGDGGAASRSNLRSRGSNATSVNLRGVRDRSKQHPNESRSESSSEAGSLQFDQFLDAQGSDEEDPDRPREKGRKSRGKSYGASRQSIVLHYSSGEHFLQRSNLRMVHVCAESALLMVFRVNIFTSTSYQTEWKAGVQ